MTVRGDGLLCHLWQNLAQDAPSPSCTREDATYAGLPVCLFMARVSHSVHDSDSTCSLSDGWSRDCMNAWALAQFAQIFSNCNALQGCPTCFYTHRSTGCAW